MDTTMTQRNIRRKLPRRRQREVEVRKLPRESARKQKETAWNTMVATSRQTRQLTDGSIEERTQIGPKTWLIRNIRARPKWRIEGPPVAFQFCRLLEVDLGDANGMKDYLTFLRQNGLKEMGNEGIPPWGVLLCPTRGAWRLRQYVFRVRHKAGIAWRRIGFATHCLRQAWTCLAHGLPNRSM